MLLTRFTSTNKREDTMNSQNDGFRRKGIHEIIVILFVLLVIGLLYIKILFL